MVIRNILPVDTQASSLQICIARFQGSGENQGMMMRNLHRAVLCLAAALGSYACVVHAQTSTPEDEYKKLIRVTEDISPLGENPFGEHVSLYTGALSFQATDISIPGTGPTIELS